MHKFFSKVLNFILFISLAIFISVFIFVARMPDEPSALFTSTFPIIQFLIGIFAIFVSIKVTKKAYQLFLSILFMILGIFQFLLVNNFVSYSLGQLWPCICFFSGISLIISGYWKYKKVMLAYLIPSFTIIVMGIWFFLFSLKIIKQPISFVVSSFGPVFIVLLVVLLIGFFYLQKKYKELVILEEDDEDGLDFADY